MALIYYELLPAWAVVDHKTLKMQFRHRSNFISIVLFLIMTLFGVTYYKYCTTPTFKKYYDT